MESRVRSFVELAEESMCAVLRSFSSSLRPEGVSAADAGDVVAAMTKLENTAAGIRLLFTGRAMEAPVLQDSKGRPSDDKLGRATGRSAKAAKRARRTSQRAQESPELRKALGNGDLTGEQADQIAGATERNPGAIPDLIAKAKSEDSKGLRDACERARAAADHDPEETQRRIHARRKVSHWTGEDGARQGFWSMTPEAAAEIELVLDGFTDAEFKKAREAGRREAHECYRADALLAMARAAASGGGTDAPRFRELIVRCDRDALLRGHTHEGEVCELRGIGPVPVSVAQSFLQDAFLKGLFDDGVDVRLVKHWGRHIPAELRTALIDRDQVCAEPGCNKCLRLQDDHVKPVAQRGETSQANVRKRCKGDHDDKTVIDNAETRRLKQLGLLDRPTEPAGPPGAKPPSLFRDHPVETKPPP